MKELVKKRSLRFSESEKQTKDSIGLKVITVCGGRGQTGNMSDI